MAKNVTLEPIRSAEQSTEPTGKQLAVAPERVPWESLNNMGITESLLIRTGNYEKLLNHRKTDLLPIRIQTSGTPIYTEARIGLYGHEAEPLRLKLYPISHNMNLEAPYFGHVFTKEEKEQLEKHGNLGKVIELTTKEGKRFKAFIAVDDQTNQIVSLDTKKFFIPEKILGVDLTEEQRSQLKEGKPIRLEGMSSRFSGEPLEPAYVLPNANTRKLEFNFDSQSHIGWREKQQNARLLKKGIYKSLFEKSLGRPLNDRELKAIEKGQQVRITNQNGSTLRIAYNASTKSIQIEGAKKALKEDQKSTRKLAQ